MKPDFETRIADAFGAQRSSKQLSDLLAEVSQADHGQRLATLEGDAALIGVTENAECLGLTGEILKAFRASEKLLAVQEPLEFQPGTVNLVADRIVEIRSKIVALKEQRWIADVDGTVFDSSEIHAFEEEYEALKAAETEACRRERDAEEVPGPPLPAGRHQGDMSPNVEVKESR